ncbi:SrfA family protein [Pantoea sp. AS-PWVM4]|uniref:SrfA family protein n=1 Tax=Pantoea sp. AS-PWVM4 TaxID=1332069 RepID=UPI000564B84F|nr:SrfA family protein [Pantoea sp. AS-PWVM4]
MRNSIQGPLLRTGNNSSFKALGETGYPVFKMAFQLREAIYRLDAGRDLARHLAIPQNEQGGDRTDWYSSFAGDVIPWRSATESERASARQQFTGFQMAVQALSEQMLNAENSGAGGDRRVFAQLLKSVVNFPDDDFLYLVNGVLVITFWGFVHPTGEQSNPMHWLQPSSVPEPKAVAPLTQPLAQAAPTAVHTVETVTHTQRRKWNWRWLLWLLVALLALALILGLLRGCVPSLSLPGLPKLSAENNHSEPVGNLDNSQNVAVNPSANSGSPVAGSTDATSSGAVASSAEVNQTGTGGVDEPPMADTSTSDAPALPDTRELPAPDSAATTTPPVMPEPQNVEPQNPAVTPNSVPPVQPVQGQPLTLPGTLPDGPAQFLNGQWRVNGGIQDKLTGRPLQLQYNFKQGEGTVSVRQSNGVTCTGAAKGNVQQGALNITNPEQMKCTDDSNFIGPTIECKAPAAGHTDCVGKNEGDKTFPIRMLQTHS